MLNLRAKIRIIQNTTNPGRVVFRPGIPSTLVNSIAFNGLYCFDFAKDVRRGRCQFLYPFGFVVAAVIRRVAHPGGRLRIEIRRGPKIVTLSGFVNLSFRIGNNFNRGSCHCVLCFLVILKYTRGRLCQQETRKVHTTGTYPTNPSICNAHNRRISNPLFLFVLFP